MLYKDILTVFEVQSRGSEPVKLNSAWTCL